MNKDAAGDIKVINEFAPLTGCPTSADFAIIDLAHDEDLLAQLYGAMTSQPIEWWSLFAGMPWQSNWANGPILIQLRGAESYMQELISRLGEEPLGLLIKTDSNPADIMARCQGWLCRALDMHGELFRFYEPRMLGPLLCVLSQSQRDHLLAEDHQWIWHDSHAWRHARGSTLQFNHEDQPRVTSTQFDAIAPYRLAANAQGFARHYQAQLTEQEHPVRWVLERLMEGDQQGYVRSAQLERWLRLAVQAGAGFHQRNPYKPNIEACNLSPTERLTAMESHLESNHA